MNGVEKIEKKRVIQDIRIKSIEEETGGKRVMKSKQMMSS